jgi:hypothetical protein
MADDPCWVKKCDGEHDQYMHPKHNCLMPIAPWLASERRKAKQKVKNPVVHPMPRVYECACGKRWLRTTPDTSFAHGWNLSA